MGSQQILRRSLWLAAAAAALPRAAAADPTAIVDLRDSESREASAENNVFARELGPEAELVNDPELAAALAGVHFHPSSQHGRALAAAAVERVATDCKDASNLAQSAVVELSAGQAAGAAVIGELASAYATILRCAHRAQDVDAAMSARASLDRLGVTQRPRAVDATIWDSYPPLDAAANVMMASLTIDSPVRGVGVWVDHNHVGKSPVTVLVHQGSHVVAISKEHSASARRVEVNSWQQSVSIPLERRILRFASVEKKVDGWREKGGASAGEVTALMSTLELEILIVRKSDGATIWSLPLGARQARAMATVTTGAEAGELIASSARKWRGPGADSDQPLMRESAEERALYYDEDDGSNEGQEWWVYASILGAVGVAAGIVLVNELQDNKQRIEVTIP